MIQALNFFVQKSLNSVDFRIEINLVSEEILLVAQGQ